MRFVVFIMTGIAFTIGVIIGLVFHLPANSLPADDNFANSKLGYRFRRSLNGLDVISNQNNPLNDNTIDNDSPVANSIPITSADRISRRGEPAHEENDIVGQDHLYFDVKENQRTRSSDQVQSNDGEGKQFSHFEKDELPPAGPDTGAPIAHVSVSLKVKMKSNDKAASPKEGRTERTKVKSSGSGDQVLDLGRMTSGIHWSRELERSCPKGFTKSDSDSWRIKTKSAQIVKMEEGCGRMQNRLVTFDDASKACVRYRLNTDQIQGEIFSFYLARLLNITNLPPSMLHRVDQVSHQWKNVHLDITDSQWADGKVVIFTQWIDSLAPSYIPEPLKENSRRVHPTDDLWRDRTLSDMCDLMQWSDLIVFDYLTANLDRMVNNMFNRQWNEQMMNNPAHNLERTPSGHLVFLDNESGLFHGYRLLDKYAGYHSALLKSLCVFRQSTVDAVRNLYKSDNIGEELHRLFSKEETLHSSLPQIPEKNIKILKQRLKDVYNQMSHCGLQYSR